MDQYARVLELIDPSVTTDQVDTAPVVIPRRYTLDGVDLPDGSKVVDVDGLDPAHQWPFTVTLAIPRDQVRYVGTRFADDGTVVGGRVWIGGVEVYVPNDPISYPAGDDTAHVDVHVAEFRVGPERRHLD